MLSGVRLAPQHSLRGDVHGKDLQQKSDLLQANGKNGRGDDTEEQDIDCAKAGLEVLSEGWVNLATKIEYQYIPEESV